MSLETSASEREENDVNECLFAVKMCCGKWKTTIFHFCLDELLILL